MGKGQRYKAVRRAKKEAEFVGNTVQYKRFPKDLFRNKVFLAVMFMFISAIYGATFLSGMFSSHKDFTENKKTTSSESVESNPPQQPFIGLPQENKSVFSKPTDIPKTVFALPAELRNSPDTAKLNLLCAKELKGSENLDIEKCLKTLDEWAVFVKRETERHLYKYKKNPKDYYNSEAYFRMLTLITVLQEDYGVKYNLKLAQSGKIDWEDARSSRYVFLHGLLTGDHKGTCASMPVLYMAVGKRLGYPLKLVCAKNHIFLRWEDNKERVNLEATGPGLTILTDEDYRKWLKFTQEDRKCKYFLKSLNPSEEYALFLEFRADIMYYNHCDDEAQRIYEKVLEYVPDNPSAKKRLQDIAARNANHKMQLAEHKKTKQRQEQLKSTEFVKQAAMNLKLQFYQKIAAIEQKYLQTSSNPRLSAKQRQSISREKQHERDQLWQEHQMRLAELKKWQSMAVSGDGPPITQQQINLLTGNNASFSNLVDHNLSLQEQADRSTLEYVAHNGQQNIERMQQEHARIQQQHARMQSRQRHYPGHRPHSSDSSNSEWIYQQQIRDQQIRNANNLRAIMEAQRQLQK